MPAPLAALRLPRFVRFLLVGGLNTAFGYSLFLCLLQAHLALWLTVLLSNVGAMLFNFKTTGALVFGNRDNSRIARFAAGFLLFYGLNLAALKGVIALGVDVVPASAGLIVPMAAVNYAINRCLVYPDAT